MGMVPSGVLIGSVDRATEGTEERIEGIEVKVGIIFEEVLLRDELDFILLVEGVLDREHGFAEVGVKGEDASLEPSSGGAGHG